MEKNTYKNMESKWLSHASGSTQKTIDHWKRMIKWANNQNPDESPSCFEMKNSLGEYWLDSDCELCTNYFRQGCPCCPLQLKYSICSCVAENKWISVYEAEKWRHWLTAATEFIKQLEDVADELENEIKRREAVK